MSFPKPVDQPVAYSSAFKAVMAAVVLLGWVSLSGEQVAGLAVAFDAVLACFVWQAVTPTVQADANVTASALHARNAALADVASLVDTRPPPPTPAKKAPARKAAK